MRLTAAVFLLGGLVLVGQDASAPRDSPGWINIGVREYKSARYPEAAEAFQKAVDLNPSDATARLYLATTWMSQYIPGANSPENLEFADKAEMEFNRVLGIDPNNVVALESLAALSYRQAQGMQIRGQKFQKLAEAEGIYERLLAVDPRNKQAYYSIGVIDWARWYPNYADARADLHMRPEDPGPLRDAAVRRQLKQEYSALIENGMSNLQKALEIDPAYSDAMAYMNLFIRERADLKDSEEECRRDVALADQWVQRALEAKKSQAQTSQSAIAAPPPPPPPPPPSRSQSPPPITDQPQRVRVGGNTQQYNLIRKVDPVYPELARQARIQGVVRFNVIIGRDGSILNFQLVSGHPLLVEAARQAANQWVYKPTLLNGEPVEVVTQIDVQFSLDAR